MTSLGIVMQPMLSGPIHNELSIDYDLFDITGEEESF